MVRSDWKNLNGFWEFEESYEGDSVPVGRKLDDKILVPFPWESQLSGIRRFIKEHRAWYRKVFTIPKEWRDEEILLNFGAVDWQSEIYINGRCIEIHRGGYDPFSINITRFIDISKENELIVGVWDPGSDKAIPSGKQVNDKFEDPGRYSYTHSSGIWQTVWLEPVSK
jgi:beta-galactosidase/beta-glucuronidase